MGKSPAWWKIPPWEWETGWKNPNCRKNAELHVVFSILKTRVIATVDHLSMTFINARGRFFRLPKKKTLPGGGGEKEKSL
jgi:hypothetical protein